MTRLAVFTDLDGTLLNSNQRLSDINRQTLISLGKAGICRIVATGRSLYSAQRVLDDEFPIDYLISSTGASVSTFPQSRLLRTVAMTSDEVQESVATLLELALDFMIQDPVPHNHCFAWHANGQPNPDFERRVALYDAHQRPLALPLNDPAPATQLLAISSADAGERLQRTLQTRLPKLTVIRTTSPLDHHSTWLEIFPGNVSKSKTARWLCGELNLDTRQIATIGNDYNDIDLLEWGAYSYVVGNAPEDLRDQFTPVSRHDDNGFTEAINRWLVHSSGSLPR